MLHEELTGEILKSFYTVYNKLGYGFLEKVYENTMIIELNKLNYKIEHQKHIEVFYDGIVVGNYYADIFVQNKVIVELKAQKHLCEAHKAQLINYLKATNIEVGLFLNFGEKPEFKRVIYSNKKIRNTDEAD